MAVELQDICVDAGKTILFALKKIDKNAHGIIFVTENDKYIGTISDGDIRRAFINGADKNDCIYRICKRDSIWLPVSSDEKRIQKTLGKKIKVIPLLDDDFNVVDYASIYRLHKHPVIEPLLSGNELEYVTDCIKTNWISSQGSYVLRFENNLAEFIGVEHCLAVSSGTTALHLALEAFGVGCGDEVIVPDLTFGASVNSILHAGATPVLVDVDAFSWNIAPREIKNAISEKTKAIMPVHLYGNPCDMESIMKIAKKYSLYVIEDCAEALGATIKGRPVGSFGDAAAFSFFGNKVITTGEGGAVMFKDAAIYEKASVLRDHGMDKGLRYWHSVVGYNYRLTNLQAAVGCAQMEQLQQFRERRKKVFSLYDEFLDDTGILIKQRIQSENDTSYWLYTVMLNEQIDMNRDELMNKLKHLGIETRPVFYPMHQMPAFSNKVIQFNLRNSTYISKRGISLPSSVSLAMEDVKQICTEFNNIITKRKWLNEIERC